MNTKNIQSGVTLIEILAAILIISTLVALSLSIQTTQLARTQAVSALSEINQIKTPFEIKLSAGITEEELSIINLSTNESFSVIGYNPIEKKDAQIFFLS